MKKVMIAFEYDESLTPDQIREGLAKGSYVGFQEIRCHMIFDVKMDLTRKARFVAGGHLTEPPSSITYSSVVSRDSVRLAFLLAALNGLNIMACDIGNAYLNAPCREKVWFVAGPEFGSRQGTVVKVVRALYGLKSSGASMFNNSILEMGFKPSIADPDVFDVSNFNRQYGATVSRLGRNKAEAMADAACEVNPSVSLRILPCAVDESNVDAFLEGANLVIDGLDFFAIEARRMLFREAARRGLWTITAGPIGFSTAWVAFAPSGMSFDEYFDLKDSMSRVDQLIAFAVGLTPKATHLPYMDLTKASIKERTGPSSSLACQLASGVTAAAAIRILTKRNPPDAAPRYQQFDAYRNRFCHGKLWMGNRGPLQRLKRALLKRQFAGQL